MTIQESVQWIWVLIGVLWAIGALTAKRATQVQTGSSRRIQVALTLAGFFLMFSRAAEFGVLAWRFVPPTPAVRVAGLLLTVLGWVCAIWARAALGENWSASVTINTSIA